MPWTPSDAHRKTKAADTPAKQRLWAATANKVLKDTGNEGQAIRVANGAIRSHKDKGTRR